MKTKRMSGLCERRFFLQTDVEFLESGRGSGQRCEGSRWRFCVSLVLAGLLRDCFHTCRTSTESVPSHRITSHMLALTDAQTSSSSQDSSQKSQRSVHPCSRTVEQIFDVPVPLIVEQIVIESKRK